MFRKGIVTFFDEGLGTGTIELNTDHQQIIFELEDFPNASLLPQVGERVKCVVLEQQNDVLAKFIVRLDHKNYTGNHKGKESVIHSYEDSSTENLRTVRKMLKKRRLSIEQEHSEVSQLQLIQQNNRHDLIESKDSIQPIDSSEAGSVVETTEFVQDTVSETESDPVETVEHIQNVLVEDTQLDDVIDRTELGNQQIISEERLSQIVDVNETHENIEDIQLLKAIENYPDLVAVDSHHLPIEDVVQSTENIQNDECQEITDRIKLNDIESVKIQQDEIRPIENQERESDLSEAVSIQEAEKQINHKISQQLLEKNMNLNSFQRFIHEIKVKFFYSKRKQTSKIDEESQSFHWNPKFVIMGIILLLCVGSGLYAFERYKQYKTQAELKLQQYEKQQKEVIKKQKQEAHAR